MESTKPFIGMKVCSVENGALFITHVLTLAGQQRSRLTFYLMSGGVLSRVRPDRSTMASPVKGALLMSDQNATDDAHAGVQKYVYLPSGGERYLATVLGANLATVHWTWWGALILLHLGRVQRIALPTAQSVFINP